MRKLVKYHKRNSTIISVYVVFDYFIRSEISIKFAAIDAHLTVSKILRRIYSLLVASVIFCALENPSNLNNNQGNLEQVKCKFKE